MFSVDTDEDYSPPEHRAMIPHARAVFVSDFMGDLGAVKLALTKAADRGVRGVLYVAAMGHLVGARFRWR